MDWLLITVTVLSLISSIVAWIAKIKWSNEFKEAKEAQITTLKERLEHYKEISSTELLDYFKESKLHFENTLEEARDELKKERIKNRSGHLSKEEYENKIEALIDEKEVLLEEIHHRVKNNLAVISGITALQSYDYDDETFKKETNKLQKRIRSIAFVHDAVYSSDFIDRVSLDFILKELLSLYKFSYDELHEFDGVTLNVNQAVPLSLLVNELFNQLELFHAKKVGIYFRMEQNTVNLLFKSDTFIENEIFTDKNSVGYTLLSTLASQLKGHFSITEEMKLSFPKKPTY
jgi:two-component sensor histidine kinase